MGEAQSSQLPLGWMPHDLTEQAQAPQQWAHHCLPVYSTARKNCIDTRFSKHYIQLQDVRSRT